MVENLSIYLQSAQLAALFLDALVKSLVALALAGGVCAAWRQASAGTRHLIWFLAVASLPFLPLLNLTHPSWQQPVWAMFPPPLIQATKFHSRSTCRTARSRRTDTKPVGHA